MSMIERIKAKARLNTRRIVLPEGEEPRTVAAAAEVKSEGLACPILLGNPQTIQAVAERQGVDIGGIEIVDPQNSLCIKYCM